MSDYTPEEKPQSDQEGGDTSTSADAGGSDEKPINTGTGTDDEQ